VLTVPADRFVRPRCVSTFDLPADAACGFRARVDTARLRPGTYNFRAFQLTPTRGFYTSPIGDPKLEVTP
jgi:hypothetical protein